MSWRGSGSVRKRGQIYFPDSKRLKQVLANIAHDLGDPIAAKFTADQFCTLRGKLLVEGINGKTLNNRLGYVKSVFNELHRLGDIDYPNPLAKVRPLRLQERPLSYLTQEQIAHLSPDHLQDAVRLDPIVETLSSISA